MTRLTLVVDKRELSTIQAALLLLQEQIAALPEDLAEMLSEQGRPLTEREIGRLARRLASGGDDLGTLREEHAKRRASIKKPAVGGALLTEGFGTGVGTT